ncbi:probable 2-oxoglutarate-dependent dioxygenase AOP1.2 [Magnolia sinica]|uniref:probable 2-oxoglutarate-dependent dioxygenase AOP1.2 n=1 Tax=Magnolia sinica TaxID=86752 RepID=UPI00265B4653|nr:probable 2-oxoglutarate-dependent dioxygenase AOP1.2 [Magnolia sinica]
MVSETRTKIPAVDFSAEGLAPGREAWEKLKPEVLNAVQEYGCFEIIYPAITKNERGEFFGRLKQLFELPVETKRKNSYGKPFHGYSGQHPGFPLFESMGIDGADVFQDVQTFSNLMWPEGNSGFSETINSFTKKLVDFEKIVRMMILESLGVGNYHDSLTDSLKTLLRVIHNKQPPTMSVSAPGIAPHTDMNFLTILLQDEVNGIEILTKEGQWIPVFPSPNSFTIFCGDSFMAWSNGRVCSPLHQVTLTENKERFSAGFFMIPKAGWMIEAPDELVDEEHPLIYKPFDHFDFIRSYYKDTKIPAQDVLKQIAGI